MGMGVLEVIDPNDYPPMAVECPRCAATVEQRFAGPCAACIAELAERYGAIEKADIDTEYVPKMNVTPNAVALKDD